MGIWAWLILLAISGIFATVGQYLFFHTLQMRSTDYDWAIIASGALHGGFTAHAWYGAAWGVGSVVDGLYLVPTLLGAIVVVIMLEVLYRAFIRPRQAKEQG